MKIFTYSDGLTDLKDPEGIDFGEERLKNFIIEHFKENQEDFSRNITTTQENYRSGAPQADDMTFLHLIFQ